MTFFFVIIHIPSLFHPSVRASNKEDNEALIFNNLFDNLRGTGNKQMTIILYKFYFAGISQALMGVLLMLNVVLKQFTWLATSPSATETILLQKATFFPRAEEQESAKRTGKMKTLSLTGLK